LDPGCAVGEAAELVARGARVIGVDANEDLLVIARSKCLANAEFLKADLATLPELLHRGAAHRDLLHRHGAIGNDHLLSRSAADESEKRGNGGRRCRLGDEEGIARKDISFVLNVGRDRRYPAQGYRLDLPAALLYHRHRRHAHGARC
jgi:hypothetical protein